MVLHPDWNLSQGHHTDVEFKPAIARYDWDQTYDILEFVHLPSGFGMIADIPCSTLMAVDRFTPYSYRWAENYSDYLYDFCKDFNFSPYSKSIYEFEYNGYDVNTEYIANFSKGKYCITFLVFQGGQEGLIGGIDTINQASYYLTVGDSQTVDVNKIIRKACEDSYKPNNQNQFCASSLVISKLVNNQWQDFPVSLPDFILYSNIASYFNSVKDALVAIINGSESDAPLQHYPVSYLDIVFDHFTTYTKETTYELFPSHYTGHCYLQRANNNKWKLGNTYSDLGTTPVVKDFPLSVDFPSLNSFTNLPNKYLFLKENDTTSGRNTSLLIGLYPNIASEVGAGSTSTPPVFIFGAPPPNYVSIGTAYAYQDGQIIAEGSTGFANNTSYTGYAPKGLVNFAGIGDSSAFLLYTEEGLTKYYLLGPNSVTSFAKTIEIKAPKLKSGFASDGSLGIENSKARVTYIIDKINGTITDTEVTESILGSAPYRSTIGQGYYPMEETTTIEYTMYSGGEFQSLCNIGNFSDAEYLAYLQGLKAQYEEDSKTW